VVIAYIFYDEMFNDDMHAHVVPYYSRCHDGNDVVFS
jgi:hypothetical protein